VSHSWNDRSTNFFRLGGQLCGFAASSASAAVGFPEEPDDDVYELLEVEIGGGTEEKRDGLGFFCCTETPVAAATVDVAADDPDTVEPDAVEV
jgi:hypothetical protein